MKKVLSTVMSVLLVGTLFIQQVFLVSAANAQIEVEVDGTKTYFDTIQSAVESVQNGETAVITVTAGTYAEKVPINNGNGAKHIDRNITLRGAQVGNNAVSRPADAEETVLTGGIEVGNLQNNDSLTIDGFSVQGKGINLLGWGNPYNTQGTVVIQNNRITDIKDGTVSAIHMNCDAKEYIRQITIAQNYISDIGEQGNAANGIYVVISSDRLDVTDNVVNNVNHTCVQLASALIDEIYIEGNTLTNWNRDGDGGAGAGGSNGDGIYLPKKELNVVEIHENSIVRDETLPGRTGYAARLAYSGTAKYDLSNNYWGTENFSQVISGQGYAKLTPYYTDEAMETPVSSYIAKLSFSCSALMLNGTAERKLSPSLTVLGNQDKSETVEYQWQTSDDAIVALEERDGVMYAVGKKIGTATITLSAVDPLSKKTVTCAVEVKVGNDPEGISLEDQRVVTGSETRLTVKVNPEGAELPSYYTFVWSSDNESVASVDENGVLTAGNTPGTAVITVECKSFSTVKYTATATITVVNPIPIESVEVDGEVTLKPGEEKTLTAVIHPADTTDDTALVWESSDPAVVTVDAAGKVTAVKPGQAEITVTTVNGKSATVTVKVLAEYTITASAGKGGVITPSGEVKVTEGDSQSFAFKAEDGYEIAEIKVDGKTVDATDSYTFTAVDADHTIEVAFRAVEDVPQTGAELPLTAFAVLLAGIACLFLMGKSRNRTAHR